MKTRIEVFTVANPDNVICSGEWNRRLSAVEIRKELRDLMQHLNPHNVSFRIIYV